MDNTKTLFDSVQLDEADEPMLAADLARISSMIDRAAAAVEDLVAAGKSIPGTGSIPATTVLTPEHGEFPVRDSGSVTVSGTITVPRVIA